MVELYKAIAGSPITYLTSGISAAQTTISIADDSALPDAPNICTIGYGENIETIRYGAKSNGVLQNVTRGIEGTPRAWQSGTEVARFYTAHDHNAIINTLATHLAENVSYGLVVTRGISLTGVQTIALPFKAKSIICFAFISATNVFSNGFWAENDVQRVVSQRYDNLMIGKNNAIIHLPISAAAEATGTVQNVTDSGFEINWSNIGSPTGTATLYILASTH